jgi:hypothetical protein
MRNRERKREVRRKGKDSMRGVEIKCGREIEE